MKGGGGDNGVSSRILGNLLSWMSEKTAPIFVFATANDISNMPPELLRKGRFDEIWSVALPNEEERLEILKIHLRRLKRDKLPINLEEIVTKTDGFGGAEIETAVIDGLHKAFHEKIELETRHILLAVASTRPLSVTAAAQLKALEEFCKDRTRPVRGTVQSVATQSNAVVPTGRAISSTPIFHGLGRTSRKN